MKDVDVRVVRIEDGERTERGGWRRGKSVDAAKEKEKVRRQKER